DVAASEAAIAFRVGFEQKNQSQPGAVIVERLELRVHGLFAGLAGSDHLGMIELSPRLVKAQADKTASAKAVILLGIEPAQGPLDHLLDFRAVGAEGTGWRAGSDDAGQQG